MKKFWVLSLAILILVSTVGCSVTNVTQTIVPQPTVTTTPTRPATVTATVTQTVTPTPTTTTPEIPSYQVTANTTINSTNLILGQNLTIQSEIQYIGTGANITGVPTILIYDYRLSTVAQWYLDVHGNIIPAIGNMNYYQIEKGQKYSLSVNWDLVDMCNNTSVTSGQYIVWATIAVPLQNGFSVLNTNEGQSLINVYNPYFGYDVGTNTTINKTTISIGDTLTIHTELFYAGANTSVYGLPEILILDSTGQVVASWFLSENGTVVTNYSLSLFHMIKKMQKNIMDVSWGLKDRTTGRYVGPGFYTIKITIIEPSGYQYIYPATNEGDIILYVKPL